MNNCDFSPLPARKALQRLLAAQQAVRRGCGLFGAVLAMPACLYAADIKNGDLIFQHGGTEQCEAIAAATGSNYTHVGIIFYDHGKPFVYEAIQPVSRTPLRQWIERGKDAHYAVKRLKDRSAVDFAKLHQKVKGYLGKKYDLRFEWNDNSIYCSELVWKAYAEAASLELCPLKKFKDYKLDDEQVKKVIAERYGNNIPLEMTAVAPADLYRAKTLVDVPQQ